MDPLIIITFNFTHLS